MPTPPEWIENLENLRRITGDYKVEESKPEDSPKDERFDELLESSKNLIDELGPTAQAVLDGLDSLPRSMHKEFVTLILFKLTLGITAMTSEFEG